MGKFAAALAALLATAPMAAAQEEDRGVEEGFSLLEEGAKIIMRSMLDRMEPAMEEMRRDLGAAFAEWEPALRDLMARVGDLSAYHPPEVLPNGDIIIRKKRPDELDVPGGPGEPGPGGEIEL